MDTARCFPVADPTGGRAEFAEAFRLICGAQQLMVL